MPIQQWSDTIWVVKLGDEPALSDDLRAVLEQASAAPKTPDVVLDLSGLTHINSSNLSQILRVRKLAVDRDTRLRLAAPPNAIWAMFLTTGLDKVLEFTPDVSTALAGLQMGGERR